MISKPKIRAMVWLLLFSLTFSGCLGGASSSSQIKPTFTVEGVANGVTYDSPVTPKINLGNQTSLKSVTLNGEAFINGTQITDSGEYTLEVVVENQKGEIASGSIKFNIVKEYNITISIVDQLGNGVSGVALTTTDGLGWFSTDSNGIAILEMNAVDTMLVPSHQDYIFEPAWMIVKAGDSPTFVASPDSSPSSSLPYSKVELTFNPVVFSNTKKLNPFASPVIREAMNRLIDRNHLVNITSINAEPILTFLESRFLDYEFMSDVIDELDNLYAYDKASAQATIAAEMERLGAELINNTWHYLGEPIELVFLIRSEDKRKDIGDYIADQLESIGFVVDRKYMKNSEASPIWLNGDPYQGLWHLYTGGWSSSGGSLQGHSLKQFFTATGMGTPLWQAYDPVPELEEAADKLYYNEFNSVSERKETFKTGLELSLKDSVRIFLLSYPN